MDSATKKLTPKQLLVKTMPFVWGKLGVQLIATVIAILIAMIGWWISPLAFVIFLVVGFIARFWIIRIVGYGVRVGHIAVLTKVITGGEMPEKPLEYGVEKVKRRIGTAATFFVINKLVDRAVRQLQDSVGAVLSSIPLLKLFIKEALKWVDECCVAWIFYNDDDQSAWKGAIDGIVIYFKNWKATLGNAVKTAVMLWALTAGLLVIFGLAFSALFGVIATGWGIIGWVLAILIAITIKQAFLDSWSMIRMLDAYLSVAPSTEYTSDIYIKLSNISPAFADMTRQMATETGENVVPAGFTPQGQGNFGQNQTVGQIFQPQPMQPQFAQQPIQQQQFNPVQPQQQFNTAPQPQNVFCGECGTKNETGTQFCGECGNKM